jgi:predicted permease
MARRREISLRLAIGASRGRVVRQLLTESAALGLIGGAAGFAFATWSTRLIAAFMADGDPAISFDIAPDGRVLLFTAVISLGSALLAGLAPALRAARTNVTHGRGSDARTLNVSRTATLWTRVLIATQVALSLLLLTSASLLVTSLRNLREFDAGFDRDHVLLMGLNPSKGGYTGDRRLEYYRQVLERARNAPGVSAAGLSLITPISGGGVDLSFGVAGRPREPGAIVYVNDASDGYFAAMGTTLLLGRDFVPGDRPNSTPVAVINDALSRRYFKTQSPIGQHVTVGNRGELEIIGVVANAKYLSLREEDHPTIYVNALQKPDEPWGLTLAVRTSGDPASLATAIRRDVQAVAATVPIAQPSTLSAQIDRSLVKERLMTRILGAFAVLALLLASVGLYGVLGYAVTRRTNEIGIRMALGATRGTVLWSVLRESWTLVAIGVAIGVPAALALTRLLSSFLYGVTPRDPWVLSGAVACLFVVALAAASQPAWRAVRVDPLVALRYE